jgi:hypothetical protein
MCDVRRVRVTGCVARLAVVATIMAVAGSPSRAQPRDPWDGPAPAAAPAAAENAGGDRATQPDPPSPTKRIASDPAVAARVEQARRSVLDDAYQPDLPGGPAGGSGARAVGRPGRAAGGELADRDHRARVDVRDHDEPRTLSTLMSIIMWGMVIVVAILGAAWLAAELSKYGGDATLPPDRARDARSVVDGAIIERPLEDADELARRGQFAEAIHTLLLRTLRELARSAAVQVAPANTSREILARVPLLADARSALAGLITAVEITHFGERPANAGDYERCRRQFHVFAAAFRDAGQASPRAVAA